MLQRESEITKIVYLHKMKPSDLFTALEVVWIEIHADSYDLQDNFQMILNETVPKLD